MTNQKHIVRLITLVTAFIFPVAAAAQAGVQFQVAGSPCNASRINFASGGVCSPPTLTVTAGGGGGGGTVTSISPADGTLVFTPNPITTTGTIAINLSNANTWTGLQTFTKAYTGITSGNSVGLALGTTVTGDGGAGGNTANPIFVNFSPTVNLLATGGANSSGYTGILLNVTETNISGAGTKKLIDLEVGGVSKMFVDNAGGMTLVSPIQSPSGSNLTIAGVGAGKGVIVQAAGSTMADFGVTMSGFIAMGANVNIGGMAGTGSLNFSSMTGDSTFPTGDFTWQSATGKNGQLVANGSLTLTAGSSSVWSTTAGSVTIDATSAAILIGTNVATNITVGRSGIGNNIFGMVNQTIGGVLPVSGNAIAITANIHHVGAGLIKNITVPATITAGAVVQIIPDATFTYDSTGNIAALIGGGLAVINKTMTFTWDGSKWTPSY